MFQRSRYRRICTQCREPLDKHEVLFNDGLCDPCIVANLAEAERRDTAAKRGVDPSQADQHDLPNFDPRRHR